MVVHTAPSTPLPAQVSAASPSANAAFDEAKGAFLASLNHEIRTPLSGIIGMLDLLAETTLDEDQSEYLSAARLCTESLTELLNASLAYASLQAGTLELDESEFDLRTTLESVLAQHEVKAESKDVRLFLTLDSRLPETMLGDAVRLRELLSHLVSNAVKFTQAGSVELRAALEESDDSHQAQLVATVRDTGVGIPPHKIGGIFDSFEQSRELAQGGLSRTHGGLGLGLALTYRLVTVMGGRIEVASEVGRGSVFTVTLPFRGADDVTSTEEKTTAEALAPLILAVEDNAVGLRVLRHVLQRRNFRVICAASGEEAIEAARTYRIDLILMDLQMPGMNGLEAAAAIRALRGYEQIPILALTANYSDQTREECLAYGMQAFLSKPVESQELWATVTRYLQQGALV
jgi:CheY-like chemotaxis protein